VIVAPAGELDIASRPLMEEALGTAFGAEPERVLLDLRAVEFMDASGAWLLMQSADRADAAGPSLALILGAPPSYRVLELCGLMGRFEIVADDDGVAA
jgi:anti-anti-sigma factor